MKTISQTRSAVESEMKRLPGVARTAVDIQIAIGDEHDFNNIIRALNDNYLTKGRSAYERVARGHNYKSQWYRYTPEYAAQYELKRQASKAAMFS